MEEMYAMSVEIGANAFVCTSAKTGYGTLECAEDGPAVDCEPDTMSGQHLLNPENNYLDKQIMGCGKWVKAGDFVPVLESRI